MTEDEAKTKWCMLTGSSPKPDTNRDYVASRRIASACMAWRWRDFPKRDHGYCGMAERT